MNNLNVLQVFAAGQPTYEYPAPILAYVATKYDFNYVINNPPSGNDFD